MKIFRVLMFMLLCGLVLGFSYSKKLLYEDETYKVYKKGRLCWMEIGNIKSTKGPPIIYIPNSDYQTWRKVHKTKKGIFDADIFYKDLPPPVGLLLTSDMVYINKIIYYPKSHVSIIYFNDENSAYYFLRVLLDKVKNI